MTEPDFEDWGEARITLLEVRILAGCTVCGRRLTENGCAKSDLVVLRIQSEEMEYPYCASCAAQFLPSG
jgi:hypothetical protein